MLPPPTPIFITSQKVVAHVKPVIEFNSAMKKKKKRNRLLMEATI